MELGRYVRRRCRHEVGRNRSSGSLGALFLAMLLIALASLISVPAFAQSPSEDQYGSPGEDQYGGPTGAIGGEAAHAALAASGAISSASSGAPSASTENERGATSAFAEHERGATGTATEHGPGAGSSQSEAAKDEDTVSEGGAAAAGSRKAPTEPRAADEGGTKAGGGGTKAGEGSTNLDRLPKTGGVSPLWVGALLVVGGLLVGGVARGGRAR
jgi:cobalamin biosynthesis Mg chelatase CobN